MTGGAGGGGRLSAAFHSGAEVLCAEEGPVPVPGRASGRGGLRLVGCGTRVDAYGAAMPDPDSLLSVGRFRLAGFSARIFNISWRKMTNTILYGENNQW